MISINIIAAFWFLSELIFKIRETVSFLPHHLLDNQAFDDQLPDITRLIEITNRIN